MKNGADTLMDFFKHSADGAAVWVLMATGTGAEPAGLIRSWSISKRAVKSEMDALWNSASWMLVRLEVPDRRTTLSASRVGRSVGHGCVGLGM